MRKREFLSELSRRLGSYEDKDEVLDYYDEIISDRISGGEDEERIIDSFGPIDRIAFKITGVKENIDNRIRYTERVDRSRYEYQPEKEDSFPEDDTEKVNVWKLVFIIIITPLACSMLFSIIGGIIGGVCGLFGGSIGALAGGAGGAISSVLTFSGNTGAMLSSVGICLACFALGLALLCLAINLAVLIIKVIKKCFTWFIGLFKDGGWIYEK